MDFISEEVRRIRAMNRMRRKYLFASRTDLMMSRVFFAIAGISYFTGAYFFGKMIFNFREAGYFYAERSIEFFLISFGLFEIFVGMSLFFRREPFKFLLMPIAFIFGLSFILFPIATGYSFLIAVAIILILILFSIPKIIRRSKIRLIDVKNLQKIRQCFLPFISFFISLISIVLIFIILISVDNPYAIFFNFPSVTIYTMFLFAIFLLFFIVGIWGMMIEKEDKSDFFNFYQIEQS